MKKVLFLVLLFIMLVGCGEKDDDIIDSPLEAFDEVYETIPNSNEAANKLSVDAYVKNIEYAILSYEFENAGKIPNSFDDIKENIDDYSDVRCIVEIAENASVSVCGCQVGKHPNTYYKYSSKNNSGVEIDELNKVDSSQTSSISGICN